MKRKVDTLDVDKLVFVPIDLSVGFLFNLILLFNSDLTIATNTNLNAKANEVKSESPSITNLATTAALTTVENKIPKESDLVEKADYGGEIKII